MTKTPTRVGLLGAGYIAKWHAEALRRLRDVEISAVCDLSKNAAENLAHRYGVSNVYASLDDMLQAGVCDSIHVLTPPPAHFEAAKKIIESGASAFVEKPFALSSGECEMLAALAEKKGAVLGVNHNFLMLPSYARLKADMERRIIGPVDTFEANWQFPLPPLRSGPFGLWMLRNPENILFEIGPHLYCFVADLFGGLEKIDVRLRHPIMIPGGVMHYQTWQITGEAQGAAITLNLSLVEGHDNRSINMRGLGASAKYDFSQDAYTIERESLHDIVAGPFATQASLAVQSLRTGFVNAARQLASLNALSPYGLSITRAVKSFYASVRSGVSVDRRLSPALAALASRMIEQTLEKARPQLAQPAPAATENKAAPANGKTMLVIGGTGFIGRALTTMLADKGYNVRVLSRGAGHGLERSDGRVSVFTGSLHSEDDLCKAMTGVDGVYHLARATESSWQGYLDNDVAVTRRIGEACLEAGVKRLVYTGTIDSYDASQSDRTITEDTPFDHDLEHRNLYARSKAACEAALKKLEQEQNLPLVIARPGIVIGKGGPLQHWGIAMWRGATVCKLWGEGTNVLPFVLVDDVAEGLVLSMETDGVEGKSFNLIGEPMLSARGYFNAVGDANDVAIRARPTPIWTYYAVDVAKYWAKRVLAKRKEATAPSYRDWKSRAQYSSYSNEAAKSVLGWQPESNHQRFLDQGVTAAKLFGLAEKP